MWNLGVKALNKTKAPIIIIRGIINTKNMTMMNNY